MRPSQRFIIALALACLSSVEARAQVLIPAPPRLGGYVQAREVFQKQVGLTAVVNRARLSLDGSFTHGFTYRLLGEWEAVAAGANPAGVSLREAIVGWSHGSFAAQAGQFKTPFTRAYLILVPLVETADLPAVIDSLATKYDVGVMATYAWGPFLTAQAGAFNGEGQNSTTNRDSTVLYVGRLVTRPFAQLALGGSVTHEGSDSLRWGADVQIEERGALIRSEYVTRHRRGRDLDHDDYGWYVFTGYRVLPQVQLYAQQEDFRRPLYGDRRRVTATLAGVNLEPVPNRVRFLFQGTRRRAGVGLPRTNTLIGQVQVRF